MGELAILKSKEIKEIAKLLEEQFECKEKLDYAFLRDSEGDIFLINRDIEKVDFETIRINSLGLYFAEHRNDELRLSIEGSQMIGPKAKKNVFEISGDNVFRYMKGEEIEAKEEYSDFMIIKNGNDFFGCSKIKNRRLLNFYPKSRRISQS